MKENVHSICNSEKKKSMFGVQVERNVLLESEKTSEFAL